MAFHVMNTTTNKIENYTTPGDVTRCDPRQPTTGSELGCGAPLPSPV
jgi:hypothetical protein